MTQPSPDLLKRIDQVQKGTQAVRRATQDICVTLYKEGYRFPDALDYVIRDIERDLDRLSLLLHSQRLISAQDSAGRDDSQCSPTQATPENRR